MADHHDPYDERLNGQGADSRSLMRPAEYPSMGLWLIATLAAVGFIAATYGVGQYTATTALETAASQVETTGAVSTPSPPPSTTGQGGAR